MTSTTMKTSLILASGLAAAALLVGCAAALSAGGDLDQQFQSMMKGSFRSQGIATMDRLDQDAGQAACSSGQAPGDAVAKQVQDAALATIRAPADGNYLGDWREGEKLAQSGRGMTWSDKSAAPAENGANCYNCHQLARDEISFGTIGPSLYQYGKLRGVADPRSAAAKPMIEYTWGKLYNAWAYNACSNMPRFGHKGLLDQTQMKHVMALLLDPASPVNAK